jgi:hypothetical protein
VVDGVAERVEKVVVVIRIFVYIIYYNNSTRHIYLKVIYLQKVYLVDGDIFSHYHNI